MKRVGGIVCVEQGVFETSHPHGGVEGRVVHLRVAHLHEQPAAEQIARLGGPLAGCLFVDLGYRLAESGQVDPVGERRDDLLGAEWIIRPVPIHRHSPIGRGGFDGWQRNDRPDNVVVGDILARPGALLEVHFDSPAERASTAKVVGAEHQIPLRIRDQLERHADGDLVDRLQCIELGPEFFLELFLLTAGQIQHAVDQWFEYLFVGHCQGPRCSTDAR